MENSDLMNSAMFPVVSMILTVMQLSARTAEHSMAWLVLTGQLTTVI